VINLTLLLITPKANVRCQVELSTSRHGGKGSEKLLFRRIYKTNCHGQEKRVGIRASFIVTVAGRGLDDPGRQAFIRPFHPFPECPASGLLPRFDTALKVIPPLSFHLPVVVPSLPATVVPAEEDSLPPSRAAPILRQDNKANTSYALYYRVCLAQR